MARSEDEGQLDDHWSRTLKGARELRTDPHQYVGLTLDSAQELARTDGKEIVVLPRETHIVSADLQPNRVRVFVEDNIVVAADIG